MNKTAWITLSVIATCAAFLIAVAIGRTRKARIRARQPNARTGIRKPESEPFGTLKKGAENLR